MVTRCVSAFSLFKRFATTKIIVTVPAQKFSYGYNSVSTPKQPCNLLIFLFVIFQAYQYISPLKLNNSCRGSGKTTGHVQHRKQPRPQGLPAAFKMAVERKY